MAMAIRSDSNSMLVLGELKKNQSSLSKQLKKVSSGMKINSAGDGAAEYSISEKMRVRLRALEQNGANVEKGADMLALAEAGVQNQIAILRTVKEKAILANNDTNTDTDRQIIQKEINQGYEQMMDIAADTMYNNRRVLMEGADVVEVVKSWAVRDKAEKVEGSELDGLLTYRQHETAMIDSLDGQDGPFDTFIEWKEKSKNSNPPPQVKALGLAATQKMTDGEPAKPNTYTIDFSQYASVAELNNVGFTLGTSISTHVVLTNNKRNNYRGSVTTVDISSCSTLEQVAAAVAKNYYFAIDAKSDGTKVTFTTKYSTGSYTNRYTATGYSLTGGTGTTGSSAARPSSPASPAASATGLGNVSRLTGGANQVGQPGVPDMPYTPGKNAAGSWNIANVPAGSGLVLSYSGTPTYVKFTEGNAAPRRDPTTNIYTVGKQATGALTVGGVRVSFAGGTMTATTTNASTGATSGAAFSIKDGFPEGAAKPYDPGSAGSAGTQITYTPVTALKDSAVTNHKTGKDAVAAKFDWDLSAYQNADADKLEQFISNLAGKGISINGGNGVQFVDSGAIKDGIPTTAALHKLNDNAAVNNITGLSPRPHVFKTIDLNNMRTLLKKPMTIANAFASLLSGQSGVSFLPATANVSKNTVTGIRFSGAAGSTVDVYEGELRHYDLDFGQWFAKHPEAKIPADLDGKGFRAYCATDNSQWFNFVFQNGTDVKDDKPLSGTDKQDIKTLLIDVSQVTDAGSLVKAIYDQAMPILTGGDARFNHLMRLAGDTETGVLTLYDDRRFPVSFYPDYQKKGAKISSGVMDNVVREYRNIYVDRLIIQDTDHASQNISVSIPRTTLDHVFGYIPGSHQPEDFHVLTQESREKLLGREPEVGTLDKGLDYLIDANTLIGAQINRMRNAEDNITTVKENTQLSESTIRDANMAKEMSSYVRANILSQTAQGMLAQANQNSGQVLSLLS